MKIYDISIPISKEMPVWPGDPPVELERVQSMDAGADVNVSRFSASVHIGTHVDAPDHFLNNGRTVDSLSLEVLVGPALVVQIPAEESLITADLLDSLAIPKGYGRILFKTSNSDLWQRMEAEFYPEFVAVAPDGANWLLEYGARLVGVDYLSIAPFNQGIPTHRILLEAGIVVVEGLALSQVEPGEYELYCLPLNLVGSDGAPARVILVS